MSPNPDFMDEVRSQFPDVEQQLLVVSSLSTAALWNCRVSDHNRPVMLVVVM